jgi:hypothetical protein
VRRLAVLLALGAVALPAGAAATTEPSIVVGVDVSLAPHTVRVSPSAVRRGTYVRFNVRNTTSSRHVFRLAGRSIAVPARRNRFLVLFFDYRGRYTYMSRGSGTTVRGIFRVT